MPTREITYDKITESLSSDSKVTIPGSKLSQVVATKEGLVLLEIQGELNLPKEKPEGLTPEEESLFIKRPIPDKFSPEDHTEVDLVKFGRLDWDSKTGNPVLYISTSQRLEGKVEKLDPPLGVLKICKDGNESCELLDIIEKRVVFRNRPLPIM